MFRYSCHPVFAPDFQLGQMQNIPALPRFMALQTLEFTHSIRRRPILFKSIVSEGRGLVTETIPQLLLSTAFLATTRLIPGAERRGIIRSMPNRVGVSQPAICSAEKVPERLVIAK